MPTLRSSTVFRLLCAAIGVLSLGLLGMVGVMVYPSLASGDSATKPQQVAKPKARQLIKAKEVPIDQNLAQLSEFLYPPPKVDDMSNIWARAADDFRGWSLIGLVPEGEDKGFVFLQKKPEGRTVVLGVGQSRDLDYLSVVQIHDGMVQIKVNSEMGVLKRVGGIASVPGQPAAQLPSVMSGNSVGAATWNGTSLPPPPTMPAPAPMSRVTIRGVMAGSPPAGSPPTMSTSATPTGGPGMFRSRGNRTGRPGNVPGTNGGGTTSGPSR